MKILLLVAMEKEAKPMIQALGMEIAPIEQQLPKWLQTTVYSKSIHEHELFLVTAGKDRLHQVDSLGSGILPAATLALDRLNPDLVINAGSAGGAGLAGCRAGDIFLCTGVASFHDQLLAPDEVHMPYGVGHYPLPDVAVFAQTLGLKIAGISTGQALLAGEAESKQFKDNQAALKDMEAAHIARLCTQADKNYILIKAVSDLIDADECPQEQFSKNIGDVMLSLAEKLKELIGLITRPEIALEDKDEAQPDESLQWLYKLFKQPTFNKKKSVDEKNKLAPFSPHQS